MGVAVVWFGLLLMIFCRWQLRFSVLPGWPTSIGYLFLPVCLQVLEFWVLARCCTSASPFPCCAARLAVHFGSLVPCFQL